MNNRIPMLLWAAATILGAACFAVMLHLRMLEATRLWDDAYIFAAYARNLLQHGVMAWNVGGPPVYGCTSPAFPIAMMPFIASMQQVPMAVKSTSLLFGVFFLFLLFGLLWRTSRLPTAGKLALVSIIGLWLVVSEAPLFRFFCNGMDLTMTLSYLTGFFLLLQQLFRSPSRGFAVALGLFGGAAMWVRPEALMFTVGVPAFLIVGIGFRKRIQRKDVPRHLQTALIVLLGVGAATLLACLAFNTRYFGSALPLSFYAKSGSVYGEYITNIYRGEAHTFLVHFVEAYWPLIIVTGLNVAVSATKLDGTRSLLVVSVGMATVVLFLYVRLRVLHIMGYDQRFYHPLLAPIFFLLFLTSEAWQPFFEKLATKLPSLKRPWLAPSVLTVLWLVTFVPILGGYEHRLSQLRKGRLFPHTVENEFILYKQYRSWFALPALAKLPSEVSIASTEVGMLSYFMFDHERTDLAALNDTDIALQGFSADRILNELRPDIIFGPHPDYRQMRETLFSHPSFGNYEPFPGERLGAAVICEVFVRRDSPYFRDIVAILSTWEVPSFDDIAFPGD